MPPMSRVQLAVASVTGRGALVGAVVVMAVSCWRGRGYG